MQQEEIKTKKNKPGERHDFRNREKEEFEQRVVEIKRVTRVTSGGKKLSFRACVVIGDKKGRVGFGVAKGMDVAMAVQKAVSQAKKNILTVPIIKDSLPHEINAKFKAAKVFLKPAMAGWGLKAGGSIRVVLELAGVKNVISKMLGSNNKINNIKATFKALSFFQAEKD